MARTARRIWLVPVVLTFAVLAMGADSCDTTSSDLSLDKPAKVKKKKDGDSYFPPAKKYSRPQKEKIYGGGGSAGGGGSSSCDPNYTGDCVPAGASDVDCAGGSGDGPEYVGPVQVVGSDPYGLDADGDGSACESY